MKKKSKRPPQHVVAGIGVTFTWAEEARVRAKAKRAGVSVDDLIASAVNRAARRSSRIDLAVKALGSPHKKRKVK